MPDTTSPKSAGAPTTAPSKPLTFEDWKPIYEEILRDFGFDPRADEASAQALAAVLAKPPFRPDAAWKALERRFAGRPVLVLGAADEAPKVLRKQPKGWVLVAADGATTAALQADRRPDLIVTDLDGRIEDEVKAAKDGAYVAIHAHGDNQPAIKEWLPRFPAERVVGTCQSRPLPPLRNLGGFTDGDRACYVADALGASELRLLGFRFEGPPGKYSGTYNRATKPRKLEWSRRLIQRLVERGRRVGFA